MNTALLLVLFVDLASSTPCVETCTYTCPSGSTCNQVDYFTDLSNYICWYIFVRFDFFGDFVHFFLQRVFKVNNPEVSKLV